MPFIRDQVCLCRGGPQQACRPAAGQPSTPLALVPANGYSAFPRDQPRRRNGERAPFDCSVGKSCRHCVTKLRLRSIRIMKLAILRSEEHTSELPVTFLYLVC